MTAKTAKEEKPRLSNIGLLKLRQYPKTKKPCGPFSLTSKYGFTAIYGTNEEKPKPKTLYIRTRAKVSPIEKSKLGTLKEMERLQGQILSMFQAVLSENPHFDSRHLSNVDLSAKNLAEGKTIFLRYDVYVRPMKEESVAAHYRQVERLASTIERRLVRLLAAVGLQISS